MPACVSAGLLVVFLSLFYCYFAEGVVATTQTNSFQAISYVFDENVWYCLPSLVQWLFTFFHLIFLNMKQSDPILSHSSYC